MRKGKRYRYILPPILAPNAHEYKGLPYDYEITITLAAGAVLVGPNHQRGTIEPIVDLPHGSVEYRLDMDGVPVRTGLRWHISLREDSPAVRCVLGIVSNDGSQLAVEKSVILGDVDGFIPGNILLAPPWDLFTALGIWTGLVRAELYAVPYHDVH